MDEKEHVLVKSEDLRWMEEKGATEQGCHMWTCCWCSRSAAAHSKEDAFKELFMNNQEVTVMLYNMIQQSTSIGKRQFKFVVDSNGFTVVAEVA